MFNKAWIKSLNKLKSILIYSYNILPKESLITLTMFLIFRFFYKQVRTVLDAKTLKYFIL